LIASKFEPGKEGREAISPLMVLQSPSPFHFNIIPVQNQVPKNILISIVTTPAATVDKIHVI
jgi:hypothetical protein